MKQKVCNIFFVYCFLQWVLSVVKTVISFNLSCFSWIVKQGRKHNSTSPLRWPSSQSCYQTRWDGQGSNIYKCFSDIFTACHHTEWHVFCELKDFLSNQEFQESIGGTVDAAVNLTGTVARVWLIILIVSEPSLKMLSTWHDISGLFINDESSLLSMTLSAPRSQYLWLRES